MNRTGVVIAQALTEATVDDASTGIRLIEAADGDLGSVTADAAYDTVDFYDAAGARGASVARCPVSRLCVECPPWPEALAFRRRGHAAHVSPRPCGCSCDASAVTSNSL